MKLRPLNDRIVVQRLDEDEVSPGGIIIPDSAKEKPIQGKVVAVGNGISENNDGKKEISEGDTVLFGKYAGQEIKHQDVEYLILREDDVLAVVE